jgi:predicted alternative tryptophan synthase beta-subunit
MTAGECLTYLEDVQTNVIVTHIRRKEESWNIKTRFTRLIVVLRDVRTRNLMVATDVLYKAAVSIFRAEGANTFLETKYSIYLDTESHGVITSQKIITFISLFHRI